MPAIDRAKASILLTLQLEAASPGSVGPEALVYCAEWPMKETEDGVVRQIRLAKPDGREVFDRMLALFDESIAEAIRTLANGGHLTTADCEQIESEIRLLSASRAASIGPTELC